MQIQEKIDKIRGDVLKANQEIVKLKQIVDKFSDAYVQQDRWKNERTFSKVASPLCDKYDWTHSCGCCNDSPVYFWPYLETEFGKVFADGAPFRVLDRDEWGGRTYLRNGFDASKIILSDDMKGQIQKFIDVMATGDVKKDNDDETI